MNKLFLLTLSLLMPLACHAGNELSIPRWSQEDYTKFNTFIKPDKDIRLHAWPLRKHIIEGGDIREYVTNIEKSNNPINITKLLHTPSPNPDNKNDILTPCEEVLNMCEDDRTKKWSPFTYGACSVGLAAIGGIAGYKLAQLYMKQSPVSFVALGAAIGAVPGLIGGIKQSLYSADLKQRLDFCFENEHLPKGSTGCTFTSGNNFMSDPEHSKIAFKIEDTLQTYGHTNGNAFIPTEVFYGMDQDFGSNQYKNGYWRVNLTMRDQERYTQNGQKITQVSPYGPHYYTQEPLKPNVDQKNEVSFVRHTNVRGDTKYLLIRNDEQLKSLREEASSNSEVLYSYFDCDEDRAHIVEVTPNPN